MTSERATQATVQSGVDLLLRNVQLPDADAGGRLYDLAIVGEHIAAVADAGAVPMSASEEIDGEGATAVGGVIDIHVHLGNGSQSIAEDLVSESRMAVAGGVTTLCPYIISPSGYDDLLKELPELVTELSLVDVFPQLGIVSEDQISEVGRLASMYGVRAFKCFMGYKGADASPSGIRGIGDAAILRLMREVAAVPGARLAVHAENMEIIQNVRPAIQSAGREDSYAWSLSRPRIAETEAILRVIQFARETRCPLTIPHISSGADLRLIKQAVGDLDVVLETCPHYLLLDGTNELGVWGKVNPPLRPRVEAEALWEGINDGLIDVIGSDHCPFDPVVKGVGGSIWDARAGIPNGSAAILPALFDRGLMDPRLNAALVTAVTRTAAAGRYDMATAPAGIAVGARADLALVRREPHEFSSPELGGVATGSPYEGRRFEHTVRTTVARGRVVFHDGTARRPSGVARLLTAAHQGRGT